MDDEFKKICPVEMFLGKKMIDIIYIYTLRETNIAIENPPYEDVFLIGKGEFPLLC